MTSEHPRRWVATTIVPIRWGDMDAMGHVNNTVYFRFMEQARIEWMTALGHGLDIRDEGPVIASTSCHFRLPLVYPGNVEISLFLGAAGRSSVATYYEMRAQGSDAICADGDARLVWISTASGKSVPLPQALRDAAAI